MLVLPILRLWLYQEPVTLSAATGVAVSGRS